MKPVTTSRPIRIKFEKAGLRLGYTAEYCHRIGTFDPKAEIKCAISSFSDEVIVQSDEGK
jgi:hypothetical protein